MGSLPDSLEPISPARLVSPGRLNRIFRGVREHQQSWGVDGLSTELVPIQNTGDAVDASAWAISGDRASMAAAGGDSVAHYYLRPTAVGARIVSWEVHFNEFTAQDIEAALAQVDMSTGTISQIGTLELSPGSSSGAGVLTATVNHVTEADKSYYVSVKGGALGDRIFGVVATYDRPTPILALPGYANGDPLTSSSLNDLQDAIIEGEAMLRGQRTFPLGIGYHRVDDSVGFPAVLSATFSRWDAAGAGSNEIRAMVPLEIGQRITGWKLWGTEGASTTFTGRLWKMDVTDGTRTSVGSSPSSGTGGGITSVSSDLSTISGARQTDEVLFFLEAQLNGIPDGKHIYGWTFTTDEPSSQLP